MQKPPKDPMDRRFQPQKVFKALLFIEFERGVITYGQCT